VRHNDLETWDFSQINEKFAHSQFGKPMQFKLYGDSAYQYLVDSHIASRYVNPVGNQGFINECMSSMREMIEWHYGELCQYFKCIDFSKGLKLRQMDVPLMVLVAMLLRNAHVTMNGNKSSEYFRCSPPSFEDWVNQM
jgi:hypothetical protein